MRIVLPILLVWAILLCLWLGGGERAESIPTEAEIEQDRMQNTEYVSEGRSDWRKQIPIVGPDSTSTEHLK